MTRSASCLTATIDASTSSHPLPNGGVYTYTATWGDGSPPSVGWGSPNNITHRYASPGNYPVSLSVGDQFGLTSAPVSGSVTVTNPPGPPCNPGPPGPPTFFFAEGTIRPGFAEFVTLQNPATATATGTLTFQASDDGGSPVTVPPNTVSVPAQSRVTVNLNDYVNGRGVVTPLNISTKVTSDRPIVAERPMYFKTMLVPGGADGGTTVVGATTTATVASFAEGTVRPSFVELLTIQNPGASAGTATITFQASDDGGSPVSVPSTILPLPANSRTTFNVNEYLASRSISSPVNISTRITSDVAFIAERPMYFNSDLAGGVNGGTTVVGFPG
jgi:hypothetical protein